MSRLQLFQIDSNGYYCEECNGYNDILTIHCRYCSTHRNKNLELAAIQVQYQRNPTFYVDNNGKERLNLMSDKSKIEKHTEFFQSGMILYSQMEFTQRREWREKLSDIILEARAHLSAADRVDAEESAKLGPDGRAWLVSNNENVDSLNQPKIRKDRMSKMDKLAEDMAKLGLDKSQILAVTGKVAASQSGGSVVSTHNREMKDNKITFIKTEKPNLNTHDSLLADISNSLVSGINDRPEIDLIEAAKTAGHIFNNINGRPWLVDVPVSEPLPTAGEIVAEIIKEEESKARFDPSKLKFGG